MERLLSTPEAKAERNRLQTLHKERLQKRFDEGDPTLRKTIFGKIKQKRTGGIHIESAEGVRFAYASTPLPKAIGETAISDIEVIPNQQTTIENTEPTEIATQEEQDLSLKFEQD